MQIKTISRTIEKKLLEWIATIEDMWLQQNLRKNILVSWGSITSMLLNEPVNDYDIYINDMDVLKRLCDYYTKPFGVEIYDGRCKQEYIEENPWYHRDDDFEWPAANRFNVFIDNLKEDQIKIFTTWKKVNEDKEELNYEPVFFSPNAISLSNDIQIVCRFHGDNEQIHKTFDFIHATNYFTFEEWLVTNKAALESILTKQLRYQWSLYPLTSIIRMKKFIKRHWNISAWEILKIMFQISELDLKDPNVLEDQLIWVDIAYFWKLIEILRWNTNKDYTSQYLNTIIDRVFNKHEIPDEE